MPAKPVFTEEQMDTIHMAAQRVYRRQFKDQPKPQVKMALALGISQQSVSKLLDGVYRPGIKVATEIAVLDGKEDLEDLIGPYTVPSSAPKSMADGMPNLDACVQYHTGQKSWSAWTIAAARAGFFGPHDLPAPMWEGKLDHLEKALERARKTG